MKKALFALVAGSLLAGSVFAQTAVTAPVAAKAAAVVAPVTDAAAKVKAVAAPVAAVVPAGTASAVKAVVTPAPAAVAAPAKVAPAPVATDGKVWVNGKVFHCPGTKFYGKTKKGEYMSSADAKAKGAHVAKGQKCD